MFGGVSGAWFSSRIAWLIIQKVDMSVDGLCIYAQVVRGISDVFRLSFIMYSSETIATTYRSKCFETCFPIRRNIPEMS